MNYQEAIDYIHNTLKFGSKLGLHNIACLLDLMDNPHRKLKYVHVAGTNGKGSTVSFISSILMEAGYKVGIFTSPYLERFSERIRINTTDIDDESLCRITEYVKSKVEIMLAKGQNHPTEFEIVTAIAFQYYLENNCDIVVLEVGLGGRFDSTNVIDTPEVAVITTISYDHMAILGDTLPKIAFEKAGIIKENGTVAIYPQESEVEQVFSVVTKEKKSVLHNPDFSSLKIISYDLYGQIFDFENLKALRISMLGDHQTRNAALAVKTAELLHLKGFNITEASIRKGLENARWPGRFEVVCTKPVFIIDGAHNTEGAEILYENLCKYFPDKRISFIFGVMRDKDFKSVIKAVAPIAGRFITVTPHNDRAMPANELAKFVREYCKNVHTSDTIEEAIQTGLQTSTNDEIICAFGSLYYIGEIRKYFGK